jgi:hypothetical protein
MVCKRDFILYNIHIGTPIINVESGIVEALGWNQYGGWQLGIRSFDKKRYYYYAHLRQNYPFAEGLKEVSLRQEMSLVIWGIPVTVPQKT